MAGARDLKEDLVLPLELDLLVVDPPREQHDAVHLEQIRLFQLGGRAWSGRGSCGHRTRGRGSRFAGLVTTRKIAPRPRRSRDGELSARLASSSSPPS